MMFSASSPLRAVPRDLLVSPCFVGSSRNVAVRARPYYLLNDLGPHQPTKKYVGTYDMMYLISWP